MRSLAVSEIFGPTIQGEGPSAGQRCGFVRLGLCNLNCSWCDTPYTWDWHGQNGVAYDRKREITRMPISEVAREVRKMNVPLLVISGGEPLVQLPALRELIAGVGELVVEIETNGSLDPGDLGNWVRWNVSPKLAHSGVRRNLALTEHLRSYIFDDTAFKFVAQHVADLDEIDEIREHYGIPSRLIWVMPEGRNVTTLQYRTALLAQGVVDRGWNMTTRLQILAFGDKRGT